MISYLHPLLYILIMRRANRTVMPLKHSFIIFDQDHLESEEPSRPTIPTAVGISLEDGLVASSPPKGIRGSALNPSPPNSKPPSPSGELPPPKPPAGLKPPTPPHITQKRSPFRPPSGSSCGHGAGQELCYLCHQRAVNNVPVSFEAERKKKEQEQDRLLQQFQHMKDTESIIREQVGQLDYCLC